MKDYETAYQEREALREERRRIAEERKRTDLDRERRAYLAKRYNALGGQIQSKTRYLKQFDQRERRRTRIALLKEGGREPTRYTGDAEQAANEYYRRARIKALQPAYTTQQAAQSVALASGRSQDYKQVDYDLSRKGAETVVERFKLNRAFGTPISMNTSSFGIEVPSEERINQIIQYRENKQSAFALAYPIAAAREEYQASIGASKRALTSSQPFSFARASAVAGLYYNIGGTVGASLLELGEPLINRAVRKQTPELAAARLTLYGEEGAVRVAAQEEFSAALLLGFTTAPSMSAVTFNTAPTPTTSPAGLPFSYRQGGRSFAVRSYSVGEYGAYGDLPPTINYAELAPKTKVPNWQALRDGYTEEYLYTAPRGLDALQRSESQLLLGKPRAAGTGANYITDGGTERTFMPQIGTKEQFPALFRAAEARKNAQLFIQSEFEITAFEMNGKKFIDVKSPWDAPQTPKYATSSGTYQRSLIDYTYPESNLALNPARLIEYKPSGATLIVNDFKQPLRIRGISMFQDRKGQLMPGTTITRPSVQSPRREPLRPFEFLKESRPGSGTPPRIEYPNLRVPPDVRSPSTIYGPSIDSTLLYFNSPMESGVISRPPIQEISVRSELQPSIKIEAATEPLVRSSSGIKYRVGSIPKTSTPSRIDTFQGVRTEQTPIIDYGLTPRSPTFRIPRPQFNYVARPQTQTPFTPIPPSYKTKKTPGQQSGVPGYLVYVRRKGRFSIASPAALTRQSALSLGAKIVGTSAAATFKIVPAGVAATKIRYTGGAFGDFTKKFGLYIEKPSRRIKSAGELQEITYKGLASKKKKKKGLLEQFKIRSMLSL